MSTGHWLIKSEPYKYPWATFVADGRTAWDGVRSYEARNNLRAMRAGDRAFFYHSNEGKEIVGVAVVVREAYPDPTSRDDWSAVDFAPLVPLARPVTLAAIKAEAGLAQMGLVRRSRLSVVGVTAAEWRQVLAMAGTRLPR